MAINPKILAPFISGPLLRRIKWTWVGYGLATYAGLRLMKRLNVMPGVADKGIRFMEKGVRTVRQTQAI